MSSNTAVFPNPITGGAFQEPQLRGTGEAQRQTEHAEARLAKMEWLKLQTTTKLVESLKKDEDMLIERIINQNNLNATAEVIKAVSELKRVRDLRKAITDLS